MRALVLLGHLLEHPCRHLKRVSNRPALSNFEPRHAHFSHVHAGGGGACAALFFFPGRCCVLWPAATLARFLLLAGGRLGMALLSAAALAPELLRFAAGAVGGVAAAAGLGIAVTVTDAAASAEACGSGMPVVLGFDAAAGGLRGNWRQLACSPTALWKAPKQPLKASTAACTRASASTCACSPRSAPQSPAKGASNGSGSSAMASGKVRV